jgi:small subunit ribosomal protein S2
MEQTSNSTAKAQKFPTKEELLAAGVQFGHETRRWNPLMSKYILGQKNNIHVFDVEKTAEALKAAAEHLQKLSETGKILFVGTKKQASEIIKDEAIRAGAYFVNVRWAGGLFTNFAKIKQSLIKLQNLEKSFEEGVKDRTKYEVAIMKREWQKLNRLYSGLKSLETKPVAIVVLDTNYERSAVKEAKKIGVPVIGIVDSNSDPKDINYVIPANDDALKSIKLIVGTLADAVLAGNKGAGVNHNIKDYAKYEVKITKEVEDAQEEKVVIAEAIGGEFQPVQEDRSRLPSKPTIRTKGSKGILERIKEEATIVKEEKKVAKPAVKKEEKAPAKSKKTVAKEEKMPVKKAATKAPAAKKAAKKK